MSEDAKLIIEAARLTARRFAGNANELSDALTLAFETFADACEEKLKDLANDK